MRSKAVASAVCTLGLFGLLVGCAAQEPKTTPADVPTTEAQTDAKGTDVPKTEQSGSTVELPQDSVFTRLRNEDGTRRLTQDMKAGKVPTSCTAFYDQGGSSSVVTLTGEDDVRAMYELMGNVVVRGEGNADTADSAAGQHFVAFVRQDGSTVGFRFAGEGNLVSRDASYNVEGDAALWDKVRSLQGETGQPDGVHDVAVVSDEDALVESCPSEAAVGETVRIRTKDVLDVDLVVRVNGERLESGGLEREFVMPDGVALVEVYTEAYSFGGGS